MSETEEQRTHLSSRLMHILGKNNIKVVSFDVFDTAVGRAFADPHDLFLLVEHRVNRRNSKSKRFAEARRKAEVDAREEAARNGQQEIHLDAIYACLRPYGFSEEELPIYKSEEIGAELEYCYPIPEVSEAHMEALRSGKKVYFISDMYLPKDVVAKILAKCGYTEFTGLVVSNDFGATKASGSLYPLFYEQLKSAAGLKETGEWLHIGDNHHSDIEQARRHGLKVLLHTRSLASFQNCLRKWPLLNLIRKNKDHIEESLLTALHLHYWLTNRKKAGSDLNLKDIGFFVVGPLLYGFARWLHLECRKAGVEDLYFLSRDGHVFKKAFDILAPVFGDSVRSHYVYASRRATLFPAISALDESTLRFFTSSSVPIAAKEYISRLNVDAQPYDQVIKNIFGSTDVPVRENDERLKELFTWIFPDLLRHIESERDLLVEYMRGSGLLNETVALCDIGYFGSMQAGMAKIAKLCGSGSTYTGLYMATFDPIRWKDIAFNGWLCQNGVPEKEKHIFSLCVPLIELFFTAQHGTVLSFARDKAGKVVPVMEHPQDYELHRFEVSEEIQSGALEFIRSIVSWNLVNDLTMPPDLALRGWEALVRHPTKQLLRLFSRVVHNDGAGKSSFVPILKDMSLLSFLRRPIHSIKEYETAYWRQGILQNMSCLSRIMFQCARKAWRLQLRITKKLQ